MDTTKLLVSVERVERASRNIRALLPELERLDVKPRQMFHGVNDLSMVVGSFADWKKVRRFFKGKLTPTRRWRHTQGRDKSFFVYKFYSGLEFTLSVDRTE